MENENKDLNENKIANAEPGSEAQLPKKTKLYALISLLAVLLLGLIGLKFLSVLKPGKKPINAPVTLSGFIDNNVQLKNIPNYEGVKQKYGLKLSPEQEKFLNDNRFLLMDISNTNLATGMDNFDDMLSEFDILGGNYSMSARTPHRSGSLART